MKKWIFAVLVPVAILTTTKFEPTEKDWKKEIYDTEKAFEKMASEKGIETAFHFYADENAVIKRENDSLITGREGIRNYYSKSSGDAKVSWTAQHISVSESGDMAWTYGPYEWKITKDGEMKTYKGVFHTVWKRQKDGNWKYVWD